MDAATSNHPVTNKESKISDSNNQWEVNIANVSKNVFKKFSKAHKEEYKSVFANLDKVLRNLNAGERIHQFKLGFLRSEGSGLYRIGQTGITKNSYETRLYIYPEEDLQLVYILGLGGKSSQERDIKNCKNLIKRININTEDRNHEK